MGPLLAICGSYQMLGREWLVDGEKVPGLGLVGMTTGRPGTSGNRLVSNIALRSPLANEPVVGYENHAGRTYLDEGMEPFGTVVSNTGLGNNEETKQDGVRYKNVLGTYLHGPLLAKNPQIADWLLARALERNAKRTGRRPGRACPARRCAREGRERLHVRQAGSQIAANRWNAGGRGSGPAADERERTRKPPSPHTNAKARLRPYARDTHGGRSRAFCLESISRKRKRAGHFCPARVHSWSQRPDSNR